jgi:ElaB/YqjD/DUF883 family membrane-anchored ribosome-binding protein
VTTFVFPTSVVTASEAEAMVMGLLTSKVNETRDAIASTTNGIRPINARFEQLTGMTQAEADNEFANLDAQIQHLMTLRYALQNRVDAHLSQQRIAASVAAHIQTKVA